MRILAVTNMYPTPTHPASGTFIEEQVKGLESVGVHVDLLFVERRQKGMAAYLGLPAQLRSRLQGSRIELVHVMYGGVMADCVTRIIRNRPTVVTFHGSDLLGENLSGLTRKWISSYGVTASVRAARRATGVIVVSKDLERSLPRVVDRATVRVIPCGIDLARFRPIDKSACRRELGWDEKNFHVLFNSNGNDPVKRPELARATVDKLKSRGIAAELHVLRGVPHRDVPRWLNAGDALLLTSLHEGSPTIVKEALACGMPVISVDVGDVRELLEGVRRCHIASPDPADLAEKLRMAHLDPHEVNGYSKLESLTIMRIAERVKLFYQELL